MFTDKNFASALKQLPAFGERHVNFSFDTEPATRENMLPAVAAAVRREDKMISALRNRWSSLPPEFRQELIDSCCDPNIRDLPSLISRWVSVPPAVRAHFAAKLASHPVTAVDAVNFAATVNTGPKMKMKIVHGRIIKGGQIFSAGSWRAMSGEEKRLFGAK